MSILHRGALFATTALICVATPALAQTRSFDVPAQSLDRAVQTLGRQGDIQIVAVKKLTRGKSSRAVKGAMTAEQALSVMLDGSGLQARRLGANSFTVVADPNVAGAAGDSAARDGQVAGTEAGEASSSGSEIVVTGSRLPIHGTNSGANAVTVIDRARVEESGGGSVADAFRYVPQQSFSNDETKNFGGGRFIQLRGLPTGSTLVLINGRRTFSTGLNASPNAFDLNSVPISAVERIEIVPNAASAVYGSDAVGGVVNIILKDRSAHPQIQLNYGTAQGGGQELRGALTAGVNSGRFNAVLTAEIYDRNFLLGAERDLLSNRDYRRFGGADLRAATTNPANITSNTTANLPGLSSRTAVVPMGSSGLGLSPASFVGTAGTQSLDSLTRFTSILPRVRRYGAVSSASFELSDYATIYLDGFYSETRTTTLVAPAALSNTLVPATNAFNPFGTAVRIGYLFDGLGPRPREYFDRNFRLAAGVKGDAGKWTYDVSFLGNRSTSHLTNYNEINSTAVTAALASSNPATALNVFQDGPGGTDAFLDTLRAVPTVNSARTSINQGAAVLRGPLLELPGGSLEVAIGGEARHENLVQTLNTVSAARNVWASFFETRVPLVSPAMAIPMLSRATLSFAGRYDHYDDFGGSFSPQVGLEISPVERLLIRGTYAKSFVAPSLFQLNQLVQTFPGTSTTDPLRGNAVTPVNFTVGGNPNLQPERARSWTAGVRFTPDMPGNVIIEATYYNIYQESRIAPVNSGDLLLNASLFPGRVTRAAPTVADIAAGRPGLLLALDTSALNAGILRTAGIDGSISGEADLAEGKATATLQATWVDRFITALLPTSIPDSRVGKASASGTIPAWRGVARITYDREIGGVTLTARYVDGYRDASATGVLNGRRVPSSVYVDAQFRLNFASGSAGALQGIKLSAGVINLFNRQPQYSALTGYDNTQTDLRGRFFFTQFSKAF
jgi:iron complex outermembrane receptor protein